MTGGGVEPGRGRLAAWLALVGILVGAVYAVRASEGRPAENALYHYSVAAGSAIEYGVLLGILVAIGGGAGLRGLLALRRPRSLGRTALLALGVLVGVTALSAGLDPLLHAEGEQGLAPTGWDPHRAGAFAANFAAVAILAPIVEEFVYRGLGYSLLARFGHPVAVAGTGLAFALAHGLVRALPVLIAFGVGLGLLRNYSRSVYPSIVLHAAFNSLALVLAVTT